MTWCELLAITFQCVPTSTYEPTGRHMKRFILFLFVIAAFGSGMQAAAGAETCARPSELEHGHTVSMHAINVGQADAIAITCQDGTVGMLVDGAIPCRVVRGRMAVTPHGGHLS